MGTDPPWHFYVTIHSDGRLTVPKRIRESMGIDEETDVECWIRPSDRRKPVPGWPDAAGPVVAATSGNS